MNAHLRLIKILFKSLNFNNYEKKSIPDKILLAQRFNPVGQDGLLTKNQY